MKDDTLANSDLIFYPDSGAADVCDVARRALIASHLDWNSRTTDKVILPRRP